MTNYNTYKLNYYSYNNSKVHTAFVPAMSFNQACIILSKEAKKKGIDIVILYS